MDIPEQLPEEPEIVGEPVVQESVPPEDLFIIEPVPEPLPQLTPEEAEQLLLEALLTPEQMAELGSFDSPLEAIQSRARQIAETSVA